MSNPQASSKAAATFSSDGSDDFSTSAKQLLIVTTVVGGTFIIAVLIYALYQRNRKTNIQRGRHRRSSTVTDPALDDQKEGTTALPIYRKTEYDVHSVGPNSFGNMSRIFKHTVQVASHPRPPTSSSRLSGEKPAMARSRSPPRKSHRSSTNGITFLRDASPPPSETIVTRTVIARPDSAVLPTPTTIGPNASDFHDKFHTEGNSTSPPASPTSTVSFENPQDRWSWTNSQAPTTPRMKAPDARNSLLGMPPPPFRPVSNWIRSQPSRIEEESQTMPKVPPPLLRKLSLQAQGGLNRSRSVLSNFRRPSTSKG